MATTFLTPKNNAATTLAEPLDDSETDIDVTDASVFPADGDCPFHITVDDEIMEVTGIANNTLTVTRGAESTTPAEHDNGKAIRLNITAKALSDLNTAVNALENRSGGYSITVENPGSSEDISIAFTNRAITITEMRAVLIGSDTPSVTWTIRHHATDRSNAGNEVVTGGTTTTSLTTGSDVTSFDDATIPADSFIWLETTAKGGTVTELHVTIVYTVD